MNPENALDAFIFIIFQATPPFSYPPRFLGHILLKSKRLGKTCRALSGTTCPRQRACPQRPLQLAAE